jgi:ubiquinone/menaquinone biosynthesis C-methylase UbiE
MTYDEQTAADYRSARDIPRDGLTAWRAAIEAVAPLAQGQTVLDVGAGTGAFAAAFCDWFGVQVVAVEPAAAMRSLIPDRPDVQVVDGRADALRVPDASADAAWLGSVIHHIPDLVRAAAELRRALKPGAPVLIRNAFPGRCDRDLRVRFFPETSRTIAGYPSVDQVCAAFATAGFEQVSLRSVPQLSAPNMGEFVARVRRETDSKLRALTDAEFEAGMARLRAADPTEPAMSWMDLLVLA